jgi:hypothetical protein
VCCAPAHYPNGIAVMIQAGLSALFMNPVVRFATSHQHIPFVYP